MMIKGQPHDIVSQSDIFNLGIAALHWQVEALMFSEGKSLAEVLGQETGDSPF